MIVTILPNGAPQIRCNVKGLLMRPMALWLLEQGKLLVLTQASDQERSALVKPPGGMDGLLRRMGRG